MNITRLRALLFVLFLFTSTVFAAGPQFLHSHVPAALAHLKPLGSVPSTNNLNLAIALPLRNQTELSNLINQIYDPASPNYHHYLTPAQFTAEFGPTEKDYQAVQAFARANGLKVTGTYPNRGLVDVQGSVRDIERTLHITLNVYQHPSENRKFYAPSTEPSLDLSVSILHITGLDNYGLPRPRLIANKIENGQNALPNANGSGPGGTYSGTDFRKAYVPDSTLNGSGQIVGLLELDGYSASDITYYQNYAGLPNIPLQNVLIDGATGAPDGSGGVVEVDLDIEVAMAMATNLAKVVVFIAPNAGNPFVDVLNSMVSSNQIKQFSCSWYVPGGTAEPAADQIWQQMAVQGQSFFNASGDSDAWTGLISFPGDSPYMTQVGGTALATSSPNGTWMSETVWNVGNGAGSSGGVSTQYPIPTWQTNIDMSDNQGSTTHRNTPDVAMTAQNIYVRASGGNYNVSGTSCAAPLWAGFAALVNQQAASGGKATVGFINPALDTIGSSQSYTTIFHDITTGNNTSGSSPTKYYAVSGYDLCTGWGTPAGQRLINALVNPEPLIITPATGFNSIGGVGGPFTITSENFALTNGETNTLSWTLSNTSAWLTVSSSSGTLSPGGPATAVKVSFNTATSNLAVGTYTTTLWFTNVNDGIGQSRQFGLSVIAPPTITTQPTNEAVLENAPASFAITATGGLPLAYQWQFKGTNLIDGTNISGSLTTNLTIKHVLAINVGNYDIVVTNIAGIAVSSNAALTITPSIPVIISQPTNQTVVINHIAIFGVTVVGTTPYSYQWSFNGTNIVGATNSIYTLSNVQFTNAGLYSVLVTNTLGSAQSSNALLTVLLAPPCDPSPSGIVSWWPAEGNASDIIGTNNGILQGAVSFGPGEVGQAFLYTTTNDAVRIPASSSLNVGSGSGFTLEAWINPSDASQLRPIFEWNNGAGSFGVHLYISTDNGPGTLYANVVDSSGTWHQMLSVNAPLTTNVFQHVALTYDQASGTATIYCNGAIVAQQGVGSYTPQTSYDLYLGQRPPGGDSTFAFAGLIDEAAIYNRALASNEVAAIYNAGEGGKCTPAPAPPTIVTQPGNKTVFVGQSASFNVVAAGAPPLSYQWSFNGTNILNATNTSLLLTNVQYNQSGYYAVTVTSPYGSISSSNALLTVIAPSACTQAPSGIVSWWPGEGSALDVMGANNGILQGSIGFGPGEVGQAFLYTNTSSDVRIPASSSLNVGTNSGFTVEAWINPSDLSQLRPIFEWNNGAGSFGVHFYLSSDYGPGTFYANVVDNNGQWHTMLSPTNPVTTNVFQHVALTYDQASGNATIYYNGTIVAQQNLGSYTPQTSYDLYLGCRPPGGDAVFSFAGLIDEPSIYNRALTQTEIMAIYNANAGGKCPAGQSPPTIVSQPTNLTAIVGTTAQFKVQAIGSAPLSYQWSFNGTNLLNATNTTLILTNVQYNQAGPYNVFVSNPYGLTNSVNALLTVIAPPPCDPPPPGIVSWWPAEGTANDIIGTNNGILLGAISFAPGEVGQAFRYTSTNDAVRIPASSSINVGTNSGFTVEAWINPSDLSQLRPIFEWNNGAGSFGVHFYLTSDLGPGTFYANVVDGAGTWHKMLSSTNPVTTNVFQHVALTYDQASGNATMYYNGTMVGQQNLGSYVPLTYYDLYIGRRPPGGDALFTFAGLIDEPSLYSRALSSNEIASIYQIGTRGKCPPASPPHVSIQPTNVTVSAANNATFTVAATGTPPLYYQWLFNGSNPILGATNPVLSLTNVQFASQGNYSAMITNVYGSTISSNAILVVTVDHFIWNSIPASRFVNSPFSVKVLAQDAANHLYTNYTGLVYITSTNGIPVSPAISDYFIQGTWTGTITVSQNATNLVLSASDGSGHSGLANPISVFNLPQLSTASSSGALYISWPVNPSGFVLQTSTNLASGIWVPVSTPPLQIGGQNIEPIVTGTSSNAFYRLHFNGQ